MPADPADFVARFTSAEVCKAAGISNATLLNWVSRKPAAVLLDEKDQSASVRGVAIKFSFNRVMQIAITAELVRLGCQPRPAAMVAITFSDLGDEDRAPGQLFPTDRTLLVAHEAPSDSLPRGECINVDDAMPLRTLFNGAHASAVVLDVSSIWMTVRIRLGLPL